MKDYKTSRECCKQTAIAANCLRHSLFAAENRILKLGRGWQDEKEAAETEKVLAYLHDAAAGISVPADQ